MLACANWTAKDLMILGFAIFVAVALILALFRD